MNEFTPTHKRSILVTVCLVFAAGIWGSFFGLPTFLKDAVAYWSPRPADSSASLAASDPVKVRAKIGKGQIAPEFELNDIDGKLVSLNAFRGKMPVVIEFGSYSCGACLTHFAEMEKLAKHYEGRAAFLFVYGREAHAETKWPAPDFKFPADSDPMADITDAERGDVARWFREKMGSQRRTIADPVDYDKALCDQFFNRTNNPLVILDTDGKVVVSMIWTLPEVVQQTLETLLATSR